MYYECTCVKLIQRNLIKTCNACNSAQKVEIINSQVTAKMLREGVKSVIDYYRKVLIHCTVYIDPSTQHVTFM